MPATNRPDAAPRRGTPLTAPVLGPVFRREASPERARPTAGRGEVSHVGAGRTAARGEGVGHGRGRTASVGEGDVGAPVVGGARAGAAIFSRGETAQPCGLRRDLKSS